MKVALIPCGTTDWHGEGRLLGRVELPLTGEGQQQCAAWAEQLHSVGLQRILHAPDELATQTAAFLARRLSIPTKMLDDLIEVDVGLWAGLTESQLKSRYPSAHRELCESPLNVHPPSGEELGAAAKRVNACIRKQVKKNGEETLGVVVRPFIFAMAQCALEGREPSEVWETARNATVPLVIELTETTKAKHE
ncbi:MAG: histidine phosphatase family protein [Phycisphaerae bacterium]|nr:histidine phosphatase family protein [Phycisphaerae bacterium]